MRNRRIREKPMAEINVVPYIDVMLVLLVIFMITAPLLTQGVNVNLPQTKAQSMPSKQTPIIVSVNRGGSYFLNITKHPTDPINGQQLMTEIAAKVEIAAQEKQDLPTVYVKGDRDVSYGQVVEAMGMLQQAGISNIGLVTDPK